MDSIRLVNKLLMIAIGLLLVGAVLIALWAWNDRIADQEATKERRATANQLRVESCVNLNKLNDAFQSVLELIPASNPRTEEFLRRSDQLLESARCVPEKQVIR